MKKYLLSFFMSPLFCLAQNKDSIFIKQLSDEILENGQAYDNLRQLTKKIGGRLAGSPQMVKAEMWGLQAVQAAGADKAWLQACMVPHWVRGKGDKVILKSQGKTIAIDAAALGNSEGSHKPITAPLLVLANFDELEARKDEVKGKIVYYNAGFNVTNVQPFTSYGQTGIYRRTGASRAAKYGAVGVIIRSLTESVDNHPHTGSMAYNDSFPKIPAVAVGYQDANALWKLRNQQNNNITLLTHGKTLPDTVGHNVVAEIVGTSFPNEYITIGGHLDSWDLAEGAHDDGAGVVQTIEILRAFKALGYQPKHSIRFVLFANEENGLRGGTKYAEEAATKNEQHIFALESDAGGFTPRGFGFTTQTTALFEKIKPWSRLLKPYGAGDFTNSGGGADIGPLKKNNPNIVLAGLVPDGQRYFDYHHARNDVFENVNKRELLLGAINMAALIYLVDQHGL